MTDSSPGQLQVVSSRHDVPADAEEVRRGWLIVVGSAGLASVIAYVVLELYDVAGPWAGLALELGAGLLLFAVLFLLERRVVTRAVTTTLARLTREDKERQWAEANRNPLTPGDFHADLGPLAVASAFVRDLADWNFKDAWLIADPNWRLCRAQAWVFNNLAELGLSGDPDRRDRVAEHLSNGPHSDDQLWQSFCEIETQTFGEVLGDFDDDRWGWSQRRRIVGPHHEVVLAAPLPADAPDSFLVDQPTLLTEAIRVLVSVHQIDGRVFYLVAGINQDAAPVPGWPPTWWSLEDQAALIAHPGLRDEAGAS